MAQAYRVCAEYVTVYVSQPGGGETVLGFYKGGTLPESATKASVDSLLAKGMIEPTDGPTPEAQAEEDAKAERAAREKATKAAEKAPEEQSVTTTTYRPAETENADRPPPVNAAKADWVTFAVSQRDEGVSEEDARVEAEAMSKQTLIEEFGG